MQKYILNLFITLLIVSAGTAVNAQKLFTKEGKVKFHSETPIETIEAISNTGSCVLDAESGKIQFAVLIKSFQFKKALMQEHFNENYMESSTYPKAVFKGQIQDVGSVDFSKEGTYNTTVKGIMTIHGVSKEIENAATIIVQKPFTMKASADFSVAPSDYDIEIPGVVKDKIAKSIDVSIEAKLKELKR